MIPKKTVRHLKRVAAAAAEAGVTSAKAGELAAVAGSVVARRVGLGLAALADPIGADHAELARMVPEKVEAFAAAGGIMLERSAGIGQRLVSYGIREATITAREMVAMAGCADGAALLRAQMRSAAGRMNRTVELWLQIGGMSLAIGGATLTPVHKAATANARRLRG